MNDLYDELGIERAATQDEVRAAYRRLASELHPDRGGDAERMQRVNDAYKVLSDPSQRARYDRMGVAGLGPLSTEAESLVMQHAVQFFEQEQPFLPDLVQFVCMHLDGEEQAVRQAQEHGRRLLERFRQRAKQLRYMDPSKAPHDFLGALLKQRMEMLEGTIAGAGRRLEVLELARTRVNAYVFDIVATQANAPVLNIRFFGSPR